MTIPSIPLLQNILSRRTWLAGIALTVVVCAILLVARPYRDVLFVGFAILATLCMWRYPETTWVLYLILIPPLHLNSGLFGISSFTMTRVLVFCFIGVLLVKHWNREAVRACLRANGFRFFALFVLANVVSAVHVMQQYALYSAFTYLEPLLIFAVSFYLVYMHRENETRILRGILIGGVIVALIGLVEIATQRSVAMWLDPQLTARLSVYMYEEGANRFGLGGRISSLIAQPVMASLYFALVATVALYYLRAFKHARWFQIGFGLLCSLIILATGTRGGMLALAVALVMLALLGPRRWTQRLSVLAALTAGALLLFIFLPSLRAYLAGSIDLISNPDAARNVTGRVALTRELLRYFQANWLWGYGPGIFQRQAATGIIPTVPGIRTLAGIENQYAAILADGGILAGISYLLFMLGALWDDARMMRQARWRAMGLTLLALLAAYFVFAATEMTITVIPNLILMAIYGAFAGQFARGQADDSMLTAAGEPHPSRD